MDRDHAHRQRVRVQQVRVADAVVAGIADVVCVDADFLGHQDEALRQGFRRSFLRVPMVPSTRTPRSCTASVAAVASSRVTPGTVPGIGTSTPDAPVDSPAVLERATGEHCQIGARQVEVPRRHSHGSLRHRGGK